MLAGVLLLSLVGVAGAQSSDPVLLSNLDQTGVIANGARGARLFGQAFRTGGVEAGYVVTGLTVGAFGSVVAGVSNAATRVGVWLRADDRGVPGDVLFETETALPAQSSLSDHSGVVSVDLGDGVHLVAGTKYWVVWGRTATMTGTGWWAGTHVAGSALDSDSLEGWSLTGDLRYDTTAAWPAATSTERSGRVELAGAVRVRVDSGRVSGRGDVRFAEGRVGSVGSYTAAFDGVSGPDVVWSVGGVDGGLFEIDDSGVLSFARAPDFEIALDRGFNNVYEVVVQAADADGAAAEFVGLDVTVAVTDVDEAPRLYHGPTEVLYLEIGPEDHRAPAGFVSSVDLLAAADPERAAVAWRLSGADRGRFALDVSGELNHHARLRFAAQPDFETPADSGRNNVYDVTVHASDGTRTSSARYTVTVENVNEPGTVAYTTQQPTQGAELTASVTDPDGIVGTVTWQWHKHTNRSELLDQDKLRENRIPGATSASYTPTAADVGAYLRAVPSYVDNQHEATRHTPNTPSSATALVGGL